jgi:hypothetical protein
MLLAGLWAGGCVVSEVDREGFGSRATGTRGIELGGGGGAAGANADWPNAALAAGMTPAAAFGPPGEATAGRGTPVAITLDPPRLAAGEVRRVDARVAIDVELREVGVAGATAAPAGSPAAAFTGRTAGTLRGWLSVDEVDAAGGLRRGRFLTEDASLIRDGELLARIPAGRVADLVPIGDRLIVQVDGEPLGDSASRLLELCLRAPLATREWDRIAGTGPGRPHRRGDTWAIEPQAAAAMLGADAAAAAAARATGTAALAAGGQWLEMRSRAAAVADDRIIDAFGPSLADLPEAACIHRFAVDGGDGDGGFARVSLLTHRFELLEGRDRLAGERTERIDIRLGEDRRGE